MNALLSSVAAEPMIQMLSIDAQIRAFLDGDTHGEALLHALYDDVLDEEIPVQMRALLPE